MLQGPLNFMFSMFALLGREDDFLVPDRGPVLIIMIWVFTSLAFFTVVLRIAFRARNRIFGLDDFFMVITMGCFFGWSIVLTLYAQRGGGQHIWDVKAHGDDKLAEVLLLNWTSQIFGIMGPAAGKISVAALLLSIIRSSRLRWQRIYLWVVTIVLAGLIAISCSILTLTQCTPPQRLWDQRVNGTCIEPHVMSGYGTFTGSFNTFADASLAFIPTTIFWSLQSFTAFEKTQLSIVFALNILASICSGIKTQYLAELANRKDLTWETFDIFAWVTAELFLIVVCGTIPTLHPMLRIIRSVFGIIKSPLRVSRTPAGLSQLDSTTSQELQTIGRMKTTKRDRHGRRRGESCEDLWTETSDLC